MIAAMNNHKEALLQLLAPFITSSDIQVKKIESVTIMSFLHKTINAHGGEGVKVKGEDITKDPPGK
jgi:hypothetical protein